jgi:peptide/nickel transport system substrate-binding protein
VVLVTGAEAGAYGQPGVAQQLADALPPERLAHLALGAPHLVEVAQAVAPILSRPGHEVTATPVARAELARRRARGAALAIDLVRPVGPGPLGALLGLATAEERARGVELARHPPRLGAGTPIRSLTTTLAVGVIGELRVAGALMPELALARAAEGGWDLGASYRRSARR